MRAIVKNSHCHSFMTYQCSPSYFQYKALINVSHIIPTMLRQISSSWHSAIIIVGLQTLGPIEKSHRDCGFYSVWECNKLYSSVLTSHHEWLPWLPEYPNACLPGGWLSCYICSGVIQCGYQLTLGNLFQFCTLFTFYCSLKHFRRRPMMSSTLCDILSWGISESLHHDCCWWWLIREESVANDLNWDIL